MPYVRVWSNWFSPFSTGVTVPMRFWQGGLRPDQLFPIALGISVLAHAVVLSLHFVQSQSRPIASLPPLEVVLVTGRSASVPSNAKVVAQTNLDGGGNTRAETDLRLSSPLPDVATGPAQHEIEQRRRRLAELEIEQKRLLAQVKATPLAVDPSRNARAAPKEAVPEDVAPVPPSSSGRDMVARAILAARFEAILTRDIQEYEKAPRRRFVGTQAREARFAMYVDQWRQKVERIGNTNYPTDARGRVYGSLRLTVAIRADGSIESVEFDRRSGQPVLDQAAERIVRLAAPYAAFPAELRSDTDVLVVTRTWYFEPGDTLRSE